MSETDLDRALSRWFADGAETLPTAAVDSALREVAVTRQDRVIRPQATRAVRSGGRMPALIAAGLAIAVLAGIVVGIDPALVGLGPSATPSTIATPTAPPAPSGSPRRSTPDDSPDPTPETLADPTALTPFRNEAWGYELGLPASWLNGLVADDVVELVGVRILAGDRDGHIDTCTIDYRPCIDEPITTLAQLEDAVACAPNSVAFPSRERHADTTLGGEPARIESLKVPREFIAGPPAWYCVYAIHEGRPYVLAFDYWSIRYTPFFADRVDKMIASFRFID